MGKYCKIRIIKIISCLLLLSMALTVCLTSCGSSKRLLEEKIFKDAMEDFFDAVEDRDAHKIRSLFSKNVIEKDTDLQEQIEKLLSLYNGGDFEILCDYLLSGDYYSGEEGFTSWVTTNFPVSCGGERYWLSVALVYEDDIDEDNIGFESIYFFTLDEYCAYFHSEEEAYDDDGLLVFSERRLENEVRIIECLPYEYKTVDRKLYSENIKTFLNSNKNFDDFVEAFGEPNAKDEITFEHFYELSDSNCEARYLKLGVIDGRISYASIVGNFDYVESIYDSPVKSPAE